MIEIIVKNQEKFEDYFSKFKKLCDKEGFLQELIDRRYFQKPSEKRRLKEKMRHKYERNYKKDI